MDDYEQYLKLLSLVVGISTDVVHHYFEIRILDTITFETFLNREKHILFHEHIPTIECCQCALLSIAAQNKRSHLNENQFSLLFDSNGPVEPNHEKRTRRGSVLQYCLHSYSAVKNVSVDIMDITLVCEIVRKCCPSIPGNPSWLQAIREIRNYLFHITSGQLSTQEFETKWTDLATAVIHIAGVIGTSYQKTTRKQIAELKKDTLSLDDVKDIMKDIIKDINVEAKQNLEVVLRSLEALTVLKNKIENISVDVRNLGFDVRIIRKSIAPPSAQLTGDCKTREDGAGKESDPVRDITVPDEKESHPVRDDKCSPRKCYVQWKFVDPVGWDIEKMIKRLTSVSSLWNEFFEIEFVYVGSLLVETTILEDIVADKEKFLSAIKSFISAFVDVCNLDTSSKQIIVVLLDIQDGPHVTASLKYSSWNIKDYEEKISMVESENKPLLYRSKVLEQKWKAKEPYAKDAVKNSKTAYMDDRTRFAKCVIIATENCKSYILTFIESRVCTLNFTLEQFILNHPSISTDPMVKRALTSKFSPKDFDISVLSTIVRFGNLLKPNERRSVRYNANTTGDIIDRVRIIWNELKHRGAARLDNDEYEEYLKEFLYLAENFERINCVPKDTYKNEIEEIHKMQFADSAVEDQIIHYNVYKETVMMYEVEPQQRKQIQMWKPEKKETFTREMANYFADQFDNPLAQATAGAIGGMIGLFRDDFFFELVYLLIQYIIKNAKLQG